VVSHWIISTILAGSFSANDDEKCSRVPKYCLRFLIALTKKFLADNHALIQ